MNAPRPDHQPADERERRSVLDWARQAGAAGRLEGDVARLVARRTRRRRQVTSGIAALVLIGLGLGWVRGLATKAPLTVAAAADGVSVAQPAVRALADGSVVELNGGAQIEADFSGPLRRVHFEGGDAHFSVAKDPGRPFVVAVGALEVRAVGTAFSISRGGGEISVVVTEGRVAVGSHAASAAPAALAAGEGLRVVDTAGGSVPPRAEALNATEIEARLAWRVPRLEFSATPLARVVEMFNAHAARHGGVRLELADPALAPLRMSGVLRADDTESLLGLLSGQFRIVAVPQAGGFALRRL